MLNLLYAVTEKSNAWWHSPKLTASSECQQGCSYGLITTRSSKVADVESSHFGELFKTILLDSQAVQRC